MFGNRTILLWLRSPQWQADYSHFGISLSECSKFVPVYCFDPREEQFFNNLSDYHQYWNETVESVKKLRVDLQSKGSNLLIVNGSYEVLIPSLSRVLDAKEVVANSEISASNLFFSNLVEFRNQKTFEIQHHLKMHSISMKLEIGSSQKVAQETSSYYFPPFPEINPGNLPVNPLLKSGRL